MNILMIRGAYVPGNRLTKAQQTASRSFGSKVFSITSEFYQQSSALLSTASMVGTEDEHSELRQLGARLTHSPIFRALTLR